MFELRHQSRKGNFHETPNDCDLDPHRLFHLGSESSTCTLSYFCDSDVRLILSGWSANQNKILFQMTHFADAQYDLFSRIETP